MSLKSSVERGVYIVFWTQNIYELGLSHSKRGRVDGKGKGEARRHMRYRFPSLPVPRLAGQQLVYLILLTKLDDALR
jgi:hypothetical protein